MDGYMALQGRTVTDRPIISIIDDDVSMREALAGLVRAFGYAAAPFPSAGDFLRSERLHDSACLIVDLHMPGLDGLSLQRRLNACGCRVPIVFISAVPDAEARAQALRAGALGFLVKPLAQAELIALIRAAIDPS